MRSDKERLLDILEAISRIDKYRHYPRSEYNESELLQNWYVSNLQVIGEAAARISDDLRNDNPNIQWHKPIGMRNILIHGYFQIDLDAVWQAVMKDLPELKIEIEKILDSIE